MWSSESSHTMGLVSESGQCMQVRQGACEASWLSEIVLQLKASKRKSVTIVEIASR